MRVADIYPDFQGYVQELVDKHSIPAASVAVWHNKELHQATSGFINFAAVEKAAPESVFQIGSITKVMTASLIMQLVDEGRLNLEVAVKHYLSDFAIADDKASEAITVRQLLNHTSGIAGDFMPDESHPAGSSIARYMDYCRQLPLVHPVGECYSYSNAAFVIAGRLVEVVAGGNWFEAIEERIFNPLKMHNASSRPADIAHDSVAIGYESSSATDNHWLPSKRPYLPLGLTPAGASVTMTAVDLIKFAVAHLNNGFSVCGQQWLSGESVKKMQQPQMARPVLSSAYTSYAGIGWGISHVNGTNQRFYSHLGATPGHRSLLRVIPEMNLCFAVLTNCNSDNFIQTVSNELLKNLAGIELIEPAIKDQSIDQSKMESLSGCYLSIGDGYEIIRLGTDLIMIHENKLHETRRQLRLTACGEDVFMASDEFGNACFKVRFIKSGSDRSYLYTSDGRLHERV